ncbi:AI-2E family transporter [Sphingomonas sp. SM33]|uniref:AI-2E family transporter n=1 Tax=Sphingomonas telluris TaxID=2907998 RepID=A0ABS9VNQ4_9SPHN|nr:AI-2E family transporter [Sphingomonas telluris]MCH8616587.1 AI-2E family transporter [Sphingomonas telluris]
MALETNAKITGKIVDVGLPLLLLAILIALCVQLLIPFVGLLLWTLILTICFYPVHRKLVGRGTSNRMSAIIIGVGLAALILVPTAIAAIHAASSIPELASGLMSGQQHLRPPPDRLKEVPVIGAKAHAIWAQASNDMPAFAKQFGPQLTSFTKWLLGVAGGMIGAVLALVLAVIFAAITLAYADSARAFMLSIMARLTGSRERGQHYMDVIGATVRSVANGVIGVAFVQALLCGIGFFLVGIPGAGILSLLAMVLGVLQVPVLLVTLPAIVFAFAVKSTTVALLFTVWFIISGLSDAVLKPLMIGHGLEVPMPIILLGVIGGVIAYGLVGLFIGAVLLAVGYVLFREWLGSPAAETGSEKSTLQAAE